MTLRFAWDWEAAPEVKAPELAATWSRLGIDVAGVTATLVEERSSHHGVRRSLDVPTYPLAEWIVTNWWRAAAPTARPGREGLRLAGAGDGFPWPDLTLRPGPGYVAASLRRADRDPYSVRFLSSIETVLDPDETRFELARFVDATVRRLDEAEIAGTLLQEEWDAITAADGQEQEFCLVAASLGLDPYNIGEDETEQVLRLGESMRDVPLLLDLASSVDLDGLPAAQEWVEIALKQLEQVSGPPLRLETVPLPLGQRVRPWDVGYERARRLRATLGHEATRWIALDDLATVVTVDRPVPPAVAGLLGAYGDGATVVVDSGSSGTAQRFRGARALGRRTFDARVGQILLSETRRQYAEQVERAFAAEFLAPAEGVAELLNGDYSDNAMEAAARHYAVSPRVIEHQVENQIAA